jgi:hypothetical protein
VQTTTGTSYITGKRLWTLTEPSWRNGARQYDDGPTENDSLPTAGDLEQVYPLPGYGLAFLKSDSVIQLGTDLETP